MLAGLTFLPVVLTGSRCFLSSTRARFHCDRTFTIHHEGNKLLLCETILQQGTCLMQVIINWQAFFVADGGYDPGHS